MSLTITQWARWAAGVSGGTTYDEAITLGAVTAQAMARISTMQSSMGLTAGISLPSPGRTASMQAASTLAAIAALSPTSTGTWQGSVSLGAATGLTPAVIASMAAQMALTGSVGLTPAATLIARAVAVLTAAVSIDTAGDVETGPQTYTEGIALATQTALLSQAVQDMVSAASLSAAVDVTPSGALSAGAVVAFGLQAAIGHAATQLHQTAAGLEAVTGVNAASTADFHGALTLSVAAVLDAAGVIVGAPSYTVLRVASETLRTSGATGDALRQVAATNESIGAAGATDEELL